VLSGKTVIAVAGPALDWQQVVTASAEQGGTFMALPVDRARAAHRGAREALGEQGLTVYVGAAPGRKAGAGPERNRSGAEIRLIDYRTFTNGPVGRLHRAVFRRTRRWALRRAAHRVAGHLRLGVPVFASSGEAIALIEALLPTSADRREIRSAHRIGCC
jgi:predicted deacetylase